ncbi:MAG TPA: ABC transporter substrate-binding protein [Desulfosporosinus sp.]|nr:ABC transporter substrate-binding protein [Desulfosporosinus sp.]
MKKRLSVLLVALFIFIVLTPMGAFGKETIKIGLITALSGHGAPYGVPHASGTKVAVEEINKRGGILGRQVEIIVRDHQSKSEVASRQAVELITKNKVDFLTGTVYSSCGLAISAVAKRHRVLFLDVGVRATSLTEEQGHRYVASLAVDTVYEGRAMATYDKDTPNKRYWIIGSDYAYGREAAQYFKEKIKELKPDSEILGETWVQMGETDFTAPIASIARAKADMIISFLITGAFQSFTMQARPYGLLEKPIISVPIIMQTELVRPLGKSFPDNLIGTTQYIEGFFNTPEAKAFEKVYLETTKEEFVPSCGFIGYLGITVLAQVIREIGTTETESVVEALKGFTADTAIGKITIRDCDLRSNKGEFWGISKYDPKLGYSVLTNVKYIPAKGDLRHTCEEVRATRSE